MAKTTVNDGHFHLYATNDRQTSVVIDELGKEHAHFIIFNEDMSIKFAEADGHTHKPRNGKVKEINIL